MCPILGDAGVSACTLRGAEPQQEPYNTCESKVKNIKPLDVSVPLENGDKKFSSSAEGHLLSADLQRGGTASLPAFSLLPTENRVWGSIYLPAC